MSKITKSFSTHFATLSACFTVAVCTLANIPESYTLLPGKTLRQNCSSDSPLIAWRFTPNGQSTGSLVFVNDAIQSSYIQLYTVDRASGYDLISLQNASITYCGTYTCEDYNGIGPQTSSGFVSYGGNPACQSNVQSAGPQDNVVFTCSAEFCGTVSRQFGFQYNGTTNSNSTLTLTGRDATVFTVTCSVDYGSYGILYTTCPTISELVTTLAPEYNATNDTDDVQGTLYATYQDGSNKNISYTRKDQSIDVTTINNVKNVTAFCSISSNPQPNVSWRVCPAQMNCTQLTSPTIGSAKVTLYPSNITTYSITIDSSLRCMRGTEDAWIITLRSNDGKKHAPTSICCMFLVLVACSSWILMFLE